MKRKSDNEFFDEIGKRLKDFSEEPDDTVWEKIAIANRQSKNSVFKRFILVTVSSLILFISYPINIGLENEAVGYTTSQKISVETAGNKIIINNNLIISAKDKISDKVPHVNEARKQPKYDEKIVKFSIRNLVSETIHNPLQAQKNLIIDKAEKNSTINGNKIDDKINFRTNEDYTNTKDLANVKRSNTENEKYILDGPLVKKQPYDVKKFTKNDFTDDSKKSGIQKSIEINPIPVNDLALINFVNLNGSNKEVKSPRLGGFESLKDLKLESISSEGLRIDSLLNNGVLKQGLLSKNETKQEVKKSFFTNINLYVLFSATSSFQKVVPVQGDNISIDQFNSPSYLSGKRLGSYTEAGIQGRLSNSLDYYGGFSFFKHQHTLSYHFRSGSAEVVTSEVNDKVIDMTIRPNEQNKNLRFNMQNAGVQGGLLYLLKGGRILYKMGAGLSYQKSLNKSNFESEYENKKSDYLFYQLLARAEFSLKPFKIFLQPSFNHIIYSNEKPNQGIKVINYNTGLSFGLLYHL